MHFLKVLFCFFLIGKLGVVPLYSQTGIEGKWQGTITQEDGGFVPIYDIEMDLKRKGNKVSGVTKVKFQNHYAIMEFHGVYISKKFIRFTETKILECTRLQEYQWCLKNGELLLTADENGLILEGNWQGLVSDGPCIPGKIKLTKKKERA
jgi:hypothetical protein